MGIIRGVGHPGRYDDGAHSISVNMFCEEMFTLCAKMTASALPQEAQDMGARMFMLAPLFPTLTALELRDIIEGRWGVDLNFDEHVATFTMLVEER